MDQDPGSGVATVREMSSLTDGIRGALGDVQSGRVVSGGEWLTWARALSSSRGIGLPESVALQMVDALVGELNRLVGAAYPARYDVDRAVEHGHRAEAITAGTP